jgi:hypothetical protein
VNVSLTTNNTGFSCDRLIKDAQVASRSLFRPRHWPIFGPMTDAADLARRFLTLWEDYLAALLADPSAVGLLPPLVRTGSALARDPRQRDGAAGEQAQETGPPTGAAPTAGASGECDHTMAELSRRIAQLEEYVAAVEQSGRPASHARRRNRRIRAR